MKIHIQYDVDVPDSVGEDPEADIGEIVNDFVLVDDEGERANFDLVDWVIKEEEI